MSAALLQLRECLAHARRPPRELLDHPGPEPAWSIVLLGASVRAASVHADQAAVDTAVARLQRLDHPGLPIQLRCLIVRSIVARDESAMDYAHMRSVLETALMMPGVARDAELRILMRLSALRSCMLTAAWDEAERLMAMLGDEEPAVLQMYNVDLPTQRIRQLECRGRYRELLAEMADEARDHGRLLSSPRLLSYLHALIMAGDSARLGVLLSQWEAAIGAAGPGSLAQRHLWLGMAYHHALLIRDAQQARRHFTERFGDMPIQAGASSVLLQGALLIGLAEGDTTQARAILERLDPQANRPPFAISWMRLHVLEGDYESAGRRYIDAQRWGWLELGASELGIAHELSVLRMQEIVAAADRLAATDRPAQRPHHSDGGETPILLGGSQAMQRVRSSIATLGGLRQPILITGETGTGKDAVARLLHAAGMAGTPFLALNCGAVPESLAESELFGHAAGAFTGAASAREGLIESAGNGTVFLDEINAMPARLQGMMLRVLETGDFRRVGENRVRTTKARFIFASNEPLDQAVAAGRFRQDLLYRLSRFEIRMPTLRERLGDIAELSEHFMRLATGSSERRLDEGFLQRLRRHTWPGNVRELRNIIERCAVFGSNGVDLPANGMPEAQQTASSASPAIADRTPGTLPKALARRNRILEMARQRGRLHRSEAVDELRCSPGTVSADFDALIAAGLLRRIDQGGNPRLSHVVPVG